MGRAKKKYRRTRRAEKALRRNEQDRLMAREKIIVNKMRAVYARYGKNNETWKETDIKTEETADQK